MTYECSVPFYILLCDDDGFSLNRSQKIDKGSLWKKTDNDIIGGEIHLEEVESPWHWIEITKERFVSCFSPKEVTE